MILTTALPPSLACAIPSIRWSLGPSSCPALYLESLESLKYLRKAPALDLLQDLPSTVETLFPPSDVEKRHFGLVATALILIGNGFTDECHNLVTPLSWPDDIYFGYGPSVYSQVSAEARAYATYVHCLVHRREAFNVGEFGMVGFANANYWSNAVAKSPGVNLLLPHQHLVSEVRNLAGASTEAAQEWAHRHLRDDTFFESRAVHELCYNVLRGTDEELREFAERVAETEVRVLLGHALQKAGFDVTFEAILGRGSLEKIVEVVAKQEIDESIALTAARKVSSAHLQNFRSNGSIILRQVLQGDDSLSAAAGVACRLMESPACRLVETAEKEQNVVQVSLPISEESARQLESSSGVSLSPGDLLAKTSSGESHEGGLWFTFVPCSASESVLFVDRLHGTRGETPTTVVQWSKGTIF